MSNGIQALLIGYLFNDKTKKEIVEALNKNINIPIINEKTEEKILEAIYESIEAVMKDVLLK